MINLLSTMVEFNLQLGMQNEELLKELRGKVSGENRQQIQEYLSAEPKQLNASSYSQTMGPCKEEEDCPLLLEENDPPYTQKKYKRDILKVIAIDRHHVNHEYAIIKKTYYDIELCYHCNTYHRISEVIKPVSEPEYFLCGINDDDDGHLYFLHPLYDIPNRLIHTAKIDDNLKEILDWVNRTDEGYEGRLQGDIIYQFSKIEQHEHIDAESSSLCFCKGSKYGIVKLNRIPKEILWVGAHLDSMETARLGYKRALPSIFTQYVCLDDDGSTIAQEEGKNLSSELLTRTVKEITIGNRHKLTTDGVIKRATGLRNTFIVIGQVLELTHPEHRSVLKQIPVGYAAILTIQRGSVNNGLDD
jgi:hypothetical protein